MPAKSFDDLTEHYNHDELAREAYVLSLKLHINMDMADGLKTVYEQNAVPSFEKAHGRSPKDRHEIRRQMLQEDYFQVWGSLWRTAQHLMWEGVETSLDRQLPELNERAHVSGRALGSLTLDPDLTVPRYVTAVNIHEQPAAMVTTSAMAMFQPACSMTARRASTGAARGSWARPTRPIR